MDRFNRANLQALVESRTGPCVSIYSSTHRGGSPGGARHFADQLDEAESRLNKSKVNSSDVKDLLKPAREIVADEEFWKHACDGLAAFAAPGFLQVYRLPIQFEDRVVTGQVFQIRPMLSCVNENGRFFILVISQNHTRFLEATSQWVQRVEVAGLPVSEATDRRAHDRDEILRFHSHPARVGRAFEAVYSGQGVGIDDYKDEILHYFQDVDRAIHHKLANEHAPLILATVDYLAAIYRKANEYRHLIDAHVKGNSDRVSDQELRDRAWPLIAPLFREPANRALAQFRQLAGTGRTTTDLGDILPASQRGDLDSLFVVGNSESRGRYDAQTHEVVETAQDQAGAEDLLNLAAVFSLSHNRHVYKVEADAAFGGAPIAGTYFAPMNKHGKRPHRLTIE